MTKTPVTLTDRRDRLAPDVRAVCSDCWEPIEFRTHSTELTDVVAVIVGGRSTGWKHVRTGEFQCRPLCDVCGAPDAMPIQRQEFNGHQMRWETQAFACADCREKHEIVVTSEQRL